MKNQTLSLDFFKRSKLDVTTEVFQEGAIKGKMKGDDTWCVIKGKMKDDTGNVIQGKMKGDDTGCVIKGQIKGDDTGNVIKGPVKILYYIKMHNKFSLLIPLSQIMICMYQ